MDDPTAIATRYATITRKMVHDATQVAIDAFNKINGAPGTFTGDDAIKAMTKLADIAITGGSALARIPLQIQPDNGPMLVADEVASVVQTALTNVAEIAGDAAEKIDAGNFKDKWVDSAIMLTSAAVLRTAEAAEAIVAGPGVLTDPVMKFGPYTITGANSADELVLKMEKLARPGVDENIAGLVSFTPKGGVLKASTKKREFSFSINSAGIASGVFKGEVSVSINNVAQPGLAQQVIVNL
jgi:CBS domain-containing protein